MATTRPRTASPGNELIQASPMTNSGAMETPNAARNTAQPDRESTYCREITEAAASATHHSMTRRRPKRIVARGDTRVPAMPPAAAAAAIQPTTWGPQPRSVRASAVNGRVLPTPNPSTATLDVTATKSRQRCFSSMEQSGSQVFVARVNDDRQHADGNLFQTFRTVRHIAPEGEGVPRLENVGVPPMAVVQDSRQQVNELDAGMLEPGKHFAAIVQRHQERFEHLAGTALRRQQVICMAAPRAAAHRLEAFAGADQLSAAIVGSNPLHQHRRRDAESV